MSTSNKNMQRTFIILDITKKPPKSYDAILCRDLLVHLNTRQIKNVIKNVKKSGSKYLITTQFTNSRAYKNLPIVSKAIAWRPINLQQRPFFFPSPEYILNENCTESGGLFSDKSLAVYLVEKLPNL